jgi:hypothetical protein
VSPLPVLGSHKAWTGPRARATSPLLLAFYMTDTGEPARDEKESGEEAGETRTDISEALQAVRWGRGVGVWESHIHGEGPEGEGRETVQTTQGTRTLYTMDVVESWRNGRHQKGSLAREPWAGKAAGTVLTGGLGKRAVRQRALILPTCVAPASGSR